MDIGIDIIEIERIKKACAREKFTSRFFTAAELSQIKENVMYFSHLAGKFAAKEAVSKALGTGFRYFKWHDIEILSDKLGKPNVNLYGKAKDIFKSKKHTEMLVSISHSKEYAIAFAIAIGGD
jgi:holo-[acyl-carrier protein] synthase